MTISLTEREISLVLEACGQYLDIMGSGEDTVEYTQYMVETGLGSALRKIAKSRLLETIYKDYKTVRGYPSFEDWKADKESEEQDG